MSHCCGLFQPLQPRLVEVAEGAALLRLVPAIAGLIQEGLLLPEHSSNSYFT